MGYRIEHLLSPPLYLAPQPVGDRVIFVSNISGRMSLWAMDGSGSVPQPLLPPDVALFNPRLVQGEVFVALPELGIIVVCIDHSGDENLQPCVIPIDGGEPEPLFGDRFAGQQVSLVELAQDGRGAISVDTRVTAEQETYEIDVASRTVTFLGAGRYGNYPLAHTADRSRYLLVDEYTTGDSTLWLLDKQKGERRLLYGTPLEQRDPGQPVPLNGFQHGWFVRDDHAVLVTSTLFEDLGGLVRIDCGSYEDSSSAQPVKVAVTGSPHAGAAELRTVRRLGGNRFVLEYNVDGVSWAYRGVLDLAGNTLRLGEALWGEGDLTDGVVGRFAHDERTDRLTASFSSATRPSQLVTLDHRGVTMLTRNRVLGVDPALLAAGEDASFESHDGLRVSARIYLPADELGFTGARPLIYYVHGGPQSQERPDYTWFSMPLIQYFTLNGYAVFVPNARGSTGYGVDYTTRVDRDWGGKDRLDHVAAVRRLTEDPRVDTSRIGLIGRSYGGFMTQTLAGRHPELWRAAVNMFGPYDLIAWLRRLPETWQTAFRLSIGDPDTEADEIIARSPSTYLDNLACPMLVVQGANDPRVVRAESDDLVERLRARGKDIEYLVFEDEGHDFTKLSNQIHCYRTIAGFFGRHL